jgi:hypothetical protein
MMQLPSNGHWVSGFQGYAIWAWVCGLKYAAMGILEFWVMQSVLRYLGSSIWYLGFDTWGWEVLENKVLQSGLSLGTWA